MQIKILGNGDGDNKENKIPIELVSDSKLLPFDSVSSTIDEYSQYIKEKDSSNIFRLIFTIDPICSNVLFNNVSEIVYKEGSDECCFFGEMEENKVALSAHTADTFYEYCEYKGLSSGNTTSTGDTLSRYNIIRDTGFSHKDVGPFVYHCGYDIFNNHLLRQKEFHVVSKMNNSIEVEDRKVFNTLSDYVRDNSGNIVKENKIQKEGTGEDERIDSSQTFNLHAYTFDTSYSYQKAISENLVEKDGWLGFINPCNLKIPNYNDTSLNKCMNNNKGGEFIDMYPDRSLYSFIPKYNKYRNRIENNWDYCLTYPYESDDMHETVTEYTKGKINGIRCTLNDRIYDSQGENLLDEGDMITFRTDMNHTLQAGDEVGMTLIIDNNRFDVPYNVTIESTGLNGYDYTHYFTARYSSIYPVINDGIVKKISVSDGMPSGTGSSDTIYLKVNFESSYGEGHPVSVYMWENHEYVEMDKSKLYFTIEAYVTNEGEPLPRPGKENVLYIDCRSEGLYDYSFTPKIWNTDSEVVDYKVIDSIKAFFDIHARVRKYEGGKECKYYMRHFRKIPNFKNIDVYNKNYLTEDEIVSGITQGFSSSIGKVGFENTIYGDRKAQIIFNDDIDLSCLRDNLGRELSTIYLTVVKRNQGYKLWYPEDYKDTSMNTRDKDIEFSHCFGRLTAGLNLPDYIDNFNVRKIHNLRKTPNLEGCVLYVPESPKNLEYDSDGGEIDISGDDTLGLHEGKFYGDIVEFSEYNFNETVLEDVYFRFNTAQREYEGYDFTSGGTFGDVIEGEYVDIYEDEITTDDYDFNGSFTCVKTQYNSINYSHEGRPYYKKYPVNIMPEGYYYKAHYPIEVRRLKDTPDQGSHIRIDYSSVIYGSSIKMTTTQNFYIEIGDILYLYEKEDPSTRLTGIVYSVEGEDHTEITFMIYDGMNAVVAEKKLVNGKIELVLRNQGNNKTTMISSLDEYTIYRRNPLMPDFAYDLMDGTGRYIWRDAKSTTEILSGDPLYDSVFINGAHYRHENIQFYLRRQDPLGVNGLSKRNGQPTKIGQLIIEGEHKEISKKLYIPEEESTC